MRRKLIPYNPDLKEKARELRKNSTLSEVLLWNKLKASQIEGYRFLRQKPIDLFIVDFYCRKLRLAIEIDGKSHNDIYEEDQYREQRLESLGIHILRFQNKDVKNNLEGVLEAIKLKIKELET